MRYIRRKPSFSSWTLPRRGAGLNWHPSLPLSQSLDWIVDWYRAFWAGADLGLTHSARKYSVMKHSCRAATK